MESNRSWNIDHEHLNVKIQKSIRFRKKWKHELGYEDQTDVHFPYDTIYRLYHFKPDVVISSELGVRSLLSVVYCRFANVPLILWLTLSEHTESNKKGIRIVLRKFLLFSAVAILGNGKSAQQYTQKLGAKCAFYFVPYSTDFELSLPKKAFFSEKKRFFYSGQLILRKGVKEMIHSIANWAISNPAQQIELIVAGDGPEKVHFAKLDAFSNVIYTLIGDVQYELLNEWYAQVDYYLFPTLGDEWGVVVNEALASGVPIIGSIYSQAVLELIEDDKNGWKYDPLKEGDLELMLTTAVGTTNEKLEEMSIYGLKVVNEFTADKVADTIKNAIYSAV